MSLSGSYLYFSLNYFVTAQIGIILAYAFAAIAPTVDAANALLPTYVTLNLYFSGLFVMFENIPPGWEWFSWTCFLRYSWAGLMLNHFEDSDQGRALVFWKDGSGLGAGTGWLNRTPVSSQ